MKKIVALVLLLVLTQPILFAQKQRSLTEDQRIMHVLNRLGFGARPGDVERVKAMGVEKYIEQQLNPEKISDTVAENKIRDLSVINMTTAELYEKYPQPGQLLRQLQAPGKLPDDLAEARENRVKGGANSKPQEMSPDPSKSNQNTPPANPLENEKNRQAIQEYYRENGLQRPQRIIDELQASRILRAVYSERQLQEVMVDFWTNHFNIFANKGADRWLLVSYDRDTIRPHTMGKFSELLRATAESPAMLFYLDNFQSASLNATPPARAMLGQRPQGGLRDLFGQLMRGQARRGALNPNVRSGQPPQQQPGVPAAESTVPQRPQQQ